MPPGMTVSRLRSYVAAVRAGSRRAIRDPAITMVVFRRVPPRPSRTVPARIVMVGAWARARAGSRASSMDDLRGDVPGPGQLTPPRFRYRGATTRTKRPAVYDARRAASFSGCSSDLTECLDGAGDIDAPFAVVRVSPRLPQVISRLLDHFADLVRAPVAHPADQECRQAGGNGRGKTRPCTFPATGALAASSRVPHGNPTR